MRGGYPPEPWRRRVRFGGFRPRKRVERCHGRKAVGLHESISSSSRAGVARRRMSTTRKPARRGRNQRSNPYFTTEAQRSQSSEYLNNRKLFPPRPPRLRGEFSLGPIESA